MAIYNYNGQDITPSGGGGANTTRVGATDFSTAFGTQFSPVIELTADKLHYRFRNYGNLTANWHNFSLRLQTTGSTWITRTAYVRPDNYLYSPDSNMFSITSEHNWDWGLFTQEMNGALVDLTIQKNYLGATNVIHVEMNILTTTGKERYQRYDITVNEGYNNSTIKCSLTVENAYIDILNDLVYAATNPVSLSIGNTAINEAQLISLKSLI